MSNRRIHKVQQAEQEVGFWCSQSWWNNSKRVPQCHPDVQCHLLPVLVFTDHGNVAQGITKCMMNVSRNYTQEGRNATRTNVMIDSEEAILHWRKLPHTYAIQMCSMCGVTWKATDHINMLINGEAPVNHKMMYHFGMHLAVYLMVACAKRPVVIPSIKVSDIRRGHRVLECIWPCTSC